MTISSDLSWNVHISGVCSRARRALGFVYRCFGRGAEPRVLEHLYKSMVLPILDYTAAQFGTRPSYLTSVVQSFAACLVLGR